ncbi:MAG: Holliday junction branch migration DNA helicase RuvB [Candidatus Omnitrophota bacterium]|nr:Holliday junction branch migration DNA helicase RuvB [Candidatus Omnitrophota bacterium]
MKPVEDLVRRARRSVARSSPASEPSAKAGRRGGEVTPNSLPDRSGPAVPAAIEADEEQILNLSLRPKRFDEFVGQARVVENLRVAIQAATSRGEPLEHLLLAGPPGLGKTSIAHIVAQEMGAKVTATSGPAIERAGDLIGILTNLGQGDVLFIDEIHRLSKVVEEFLYPAMENFEIDFVIDKGPYAKTIKFHLKRFTLIGATTRSGLLSNPLRSRFGMTYHLEFYQPDELVEVVRRSAGILGVALESDAARIIAERSRGTPRVANRLLRRVRDYAQVKGGGRVSKEVSEAALSAQGVDGFGLDALDRRVLTILIDFYSGGPVGIDALAAALNEERDTIVDVVEPYLLSVGLLKRTARGRKATRLAYQHVARVKGQGLELFASSS